MMFRTEKGLWSGAEWKGIQSTWLESGLHLWEISLESLTSAHSTTSLLLPSFRCNKDSSNPGNTNCSSKSASVKKYSRMAAKRSAAFHLVAINQR
ncbi:unnamed protein product [Allacma fusca]|uniref:Uncharacterized protein n=1 Tax=Allacma fusca TaxID=39272 RepID=A0A8J2KJU1_9HEXA|nr:unnamed protein product [Allacma fusca]